MRGLDAWLISERLNHVVRHPNTDIEVTVLLPSAVFDDGGVALDADGIAGFGRHRDAVIGTLPGTWK